MTQSLPIAIWDSFMARAKSATATAKLPTAKCAIRLLILLHTYYSSASRHINECNVIVSSAVYGCGCWIFHDIEAFRLAVVYYWIYRQTFVTYIIPCLLLVFVLRFLVGPRVAQYCTTLRGFFLIYITRIVSGSRYRPLLAFSVTHVFIGSQWLCE